MARSNEFRAQARKTLLQIAHRLRAEARKRAPKQTTDLSRSILARPVDPWSVEVGPSVYYAVYVHDGTGLYGPKKKKFVIRPKRKKALKFVFQGKEMIRAKVEQEGQKAQPFMDDAWAAIADWADDKIADDLGEAALADLDLRADKNW